MFYIYFNEFSKDSINIDGIKLKVVNEIIDDNLNIMLCREKFVKQLYHEVINTSSFVLFYKERKNNKIKSLLSVRFDNKNKWDISLICSMKPGLGSKILTKCLDIAKNQSYKIKLVTTPIFPESERFFKKFGFNEKHEFFIS